MLGDVKTYRPGTHCTRYHTQFKARFALARRGPTPRCDPLFHLSTLPHSSHSLSILGSSNIRGSMLYAMLSGRFLGFAVRPGYAIGR